MNKAILMGRLTADPELRHTQAGKAVTSFTVAVDSGYGDSKKTDFIPCVAWERRAENISRFFHKGNRILVAGRLNTGEYTNKDGVKVKTFDVVIDDFYFVESKQEQKPVDVFPEIDDEDELPF